VELVVVPFQNLGKVWYGILPVYTTLLLGEMYKSKVSFGHAVANGFVMLWAGLSWSRHLAMASIASYLFSSKALAWVVAMVAIAIGVFSIILGLRKKDKALAEILGHTRFSCYFLIMFYPMQAGLVRWNWQALAAVLIFAIPAWFLVYLVGRLVTSFVK
jgi:hypothetical protein